MIISNNGMVRLDTHNHLTVQELQNTNWKGSIAAFEFFEDEIEKINFTMEDFFRIIYGIRMKNCFEPFSYYKIPPSLAYHG